MDKKYYQQIQERLGQDPELNPMADNVDAYLKALDQVKQDDSYLPESQRQNFVANKQQELKGLPKTDIQDVVAQIKDKDRQDYENMFNMVAGSAQPINTGRLVEKGLDKLRSLPGAESKIGQFVEENIRQPLKRNLNIEDFTKLGQETADDVAKEAAAINLRQVELEKYLQRPEVKQTAEEALMNRNYNSGTEIINPNEATSIIDPSLEITKQIEALLGKAK